MKTLSPLHDFADLRGKPFVVGGRTPDGFDCLGLTYIVAERLGMPIPEEALPSMHTDALPASGLPDAPWSQYWTRVLRGNERVGDVAFFSDGAEHHVAPIVSAQRHHTTLILSASNKHGARLLHIGARPGLIGIYRLKV